MNKLTILTQLKINYMSPKTYILLWIFTLYAAIQIPDMVQLNLGVPEFMLSMLADPYLMVYGVLTIFIFSIAKISSDSDEAALIRFGNFFEFWRFRVINCCVYILAVTASITLISFVLGVMVQFLNYSGTLETVRYLEVLVMYNNKIGNAWLSVTLAVVYWIVGMIFLSIIMNVIQSLFGKRFFLFSSIIIYLFTSIGVSRPTSYTALSLIIPTNYFVFGYPLELDIIYIHLIVMVSISTVLILLMRYALAHFFKNIETRRTQ